MFNKLGILDSGYGSLTVLDALLKEDIASQYVIYADNKNAPWGDKDESVLWPLVEKAVLFLKNQEVDALVLGCNTTDSLFAKRIEDLVSVPVFGLISYGAIKATLLSQNKHIVLLATQQTIASGRYKEALYLEDASVSVTQMPILEWVPAIENNCYDDFFENSFKHIVSQIKLSQADVCLLGCTHFPLLWERLEPALLNQVKACNPATALAQSLSQQSIFGRSVLLDKAPMMFCYSTADSLDFIDRAKFLMPSLCLNPCEALPKVFF